MVNKLSETETKIPDVELVRQARAGDTQAFDELMKRYSESIYLLTYSIVRSQADASDLSQETFIRAYRSLARYDERFAFYTWLRKIAVNLCFNLLKRRRRFRFLPLPMSDDERERPDIPDPRPGPPEESGLRLDLERALNKLPPEQRAVFVLRVNEDMSYNEISKTLGIPIGTVMSRLNRARQRLRELLKEYLP
ncbi:MAG: sigma-70 family RNA polymerase sigma factor [candidate division WOR-3 bacterium]